MKFDKMQRRLWRGKHLEQSRNSGCNDFNGLEALPNDLPHSKKQYGKAPKARVRAAYRRVQGRNNRLTPVPYCCDLAIKWRHRNTAERLDAARRNAILAELVERGEVVAVIERTASRPSTRFYARRVPSTQAAPAADLPPPEADDAALDALRRRAERGHRDRSRAPHAGPRGRLTEGNR